MESLLLELQRYECSVNIRTPYSYESGWRVEIVCRHEGISVNIDETDEFPASALQRAYDKFMRTVKQGAPQMLKVIEHRQVDEEIPA